ncbi:MAG: APC family permease [Pyrinomonadaceae bacterium]|nr:amino acid permease [Blastocatellia bacterium]
MIESKLVRGLGRWDLVAIVINTVIGAGIFGLPSKAYALIGPYSLVAIVICGCIIGIIVLCYAEVASRFTTTGGPYLYAHEAFGTGTAFGVGWLSFVVRVTTQAANINLLVVYLGFLWPPAMGPSVRIVMIAAVLVGLFVVNFVGIRQAAVTTNLLTVGKLLPMIIFIAVGLFFVDPSRLSLGELPQYSSFSSAVLLLLYAFVGFESSVVAAGETKDPQRDFPFALLVGLGIIAAFYIFILIVCIGTLPELAASERPLADAANLFMGPLGAGMIAVGAIISILGNLNTAVLAGSRIIYAMGERRELPGVLAKTHTRFRTPYVSLAVISVCTFVFAINSSFISAVAIATITRLLIYATTCLALPVFRRRADMPKALFTAPLGVGAAVLSLGLIAWLLTNVDFAKEGIGIIIALALGLILYVCSGLFGRFTEEETLGPEQPKE